MITLLRLNRNMLLKVFRLDSVFVIIGLVYVYAGPGQVSLTVSNGIYFFLALLFAAFFQAQTLRQFQETLLFYRRLPVNRAKALAGFYLVYALPGAIAFLVLSLFAFEPFKTAQVLFCLLFIKSFTVNLLLYMRAHFLMIVPYFITLFLILFVLNIADYALNMPDALFSLIFLGSTYGISFKAIRNFRI